MLVLMADIACISTHVDTATPPHYSMLHRDIGVNVGIHGDGRDITTHANMYTNTHTDTY